MDYNTNECIDASVEKEAKLENLTYSNINIEHISTTRAINYVCKYAHKSLHNIKFFLHNPNK